MNVNPKTGLPVKDNGWADTSSPEYLETQWNLLMRNIAAAKAQAHLPPECYKLTRDGHVHVTRRALLRRGMRMRGLS